MKKRAWTEEEFDVIRKYYPRADVFADEIGAMIGRTRAQVHNAAARIGVKKDPLCRSLAGKIGAQSDKAVSHRFPKGHIPASKGKKVTAEMYARMAPTMFKKGNKPLNHKEVGSERLNVDGYYEIKVAEPDKWRLKHRVIWEQHHGEIPKGFNIQFIDHNPLNCTIENLRIISRSDQLKNENSMYARYPKELVEVIRLRGSVKRSITMHNRKQQNND